MALSSASATRSVTDPVSQKRAQNDELEATDRVLVWPEQEMPLSVVRRVRSPPFWVSVTVMSWMPATLVKLNCWFCPSVAVMPVGSGDSLGRSSTSVTVIVTVMVSLAPSGSVAVTTTVWVSDDSKSMSALAATWICPEPETMSKLASPAME